MQPNHLDCTLTTLTLAVLMDQTRTVNILSWPFVIPVNSQSRYRHYPALSVALWSWLDLRAWWSGPFLPAIPSF